MKENLLSFSFLLPNILNKKAKNTIQFLKGKKGKEINFMFMLVTGKI